MIEFTIPGKITSANMNKTPMGGRAIKTQGAREDQSRIAARAIVAKQFARWIIPERAIVTIFAYNSRLDVGNIEKIPIDGIKRILIADDNPKHLRKLVVEHMDKDRGGERYVVRVEAVA